MILVMAGTKDAREIIQKLNDKNYKVIATTVTEYGGDLICENDVNEIITRPLNEEEIVQLIKEKDIKFLIDGTHPYAVNASKNAIRAAERSGIPYVRYEREEIKTNYGIHFKSYEEAEEYLYKEKGNILFTIGSNNIEKFTNRISHDRIYVRVLPMKKVFEKCEKLGLNPKNIFAMQGPFSENFNMAMINEIGAKFIVTKSTSKTGGFDTKLGAAEKTNSKLIVIDKPSICYKNEFRDINLMIEFIGGHYGN